MLPIGIEDFKEIITQNFYYIDKTNMINELLNNWSKVNLFTRPRRFGKSLNMSMLRYFFEIGTDHTLFNGLKISDEKEICKEYMGKFPVISISLKDVSGANFSKAVYKLKSIIRNESLRHQYLMESTVLSKYDKAEFEPLIASEMSDETLEQSLMILSRTLNKHHTQKVIILIDEYDVPLSKAYEYGYYDDMIMLIRGILEYSLKTNENLKLAVLTGCMRISKESIFTGMNNFKIRSVTDVKFDEYFGFTDNEVKNLLKQYHFEEKYDAVKQWYNGYKFGKVSVYCPWDVINYIDDLNETPDIVPQNYWLNTSGNDIIRIFLDKADETTKWELEQLISGETIEKEIYQEMTYDDLDKIKKYLWSALFITGYLTYDHKNLYTQAINQKLLIKIPNEKIRNILKKLISELSNNY
ncbi:MAG: AAA family ATPase [Oscillospiraceae bacterium]|nr:AAA family ATPase [Oscillospiraceae bacterium]